uniref:uncharacterized protein LOC117715823 isoform X2 n=1 Tax=Arvicanthis niloticus TaxID=61156 RepID=UPI00402B86BB
MFDRLNFELIWTQHFSLSTRVSPERSEATVFLRCQCSLRNASSKDKDNIKMKMNHLGGAKPKVRSVKDGIRRSRCLLQAPGREAPRRESAGRREDSSVLVEIGGERTQEVCPVTPV